MIKIIRIPRGDYTSLLIPSRSVSAVWERLDISRSRTAEEEAAPAATEKLEAADVADEEMEAVAAVDKEAEAVAAAQVATAAMLLFTK